jgi:hypothetical protein
MKMEAIFSSETQVYIQWTTSRYVPSDSTLYDHGNENLESYINLILAFKMAIDIYRDRLCGLVVRVPGYSSSGPGSVPGAIRFSDK